MPQAVYIRHFSETVVNKNIYGLEYAMQCAHNTSIYLKCLIQQPYAIKNI